MQQNNYNYENDEYVQKDLETSLRLRKFNLTFQLILHIAIR